MRVTRALRAEPGSILVFLPGQGEIRRVEAILRERIEDPAIDLAPLYGALDRARTGSGGQPDEVRVGARSCSRPRSPKPR